MTPLHSGRRRRVAAGSPPVAAHIHTFGTDKQTATTSLTSGSRDPRYIIPADTCSAASVPRGPTRVPRLLEIGYVYTGGRGARLSRVLLGIRRFNHLSET